MWSAKANPTGISKEICLHEGVGLASANHQCDHKYNHKSPKHVNMPYFYLPTQNHAKINPCQITEEYLMVAEPDVGYGTSTGSVSENKEG